jgi:hypothetical protein
MKAPKIKSSLGPIIQQCFICGKVDIDPATHDGECDAVEEAILRERRDR